MNDLRKKEQTLKTPTKVQWMNEGNRGRLEEDIKHDKNFQYRKLCVNLTRLYSRAVWLKRYICEGIWEGVERGSDGQTDQSW